MYKWTFFFETEKLESLIKTDEDDKRVKNSIASGYTGLVPLPGESFDLYVNLSKVKCISRVIEQDEQLPLETPQEN